MNVHSPASGDIQQNGQVFYLFSQIILKKTSYRGMFEEKVSCHVRHNKKGRSEHEKASGSIPVAADGFLPFHQPDAGFGICKVQQGSKGEICQGSQEHDPCGEEGGSENLTGK